MNKEIDAEMDDELRPKYDFSQMEGGVRGGYASAIKQNKSGASRP